MRLTGSLLVGLVTLIMLAVAVGVIVAVQYFRLPELSMPMPHTQPAGPPGLPSSDESSKTVPCWPEVSPARAVKTTLCEVVRNPEHFVCKRIARRATLLTDCLEGSVLISAGCDHGIVPGGASNPKVDSFFEGVCAGRPIDFRINRSAAFTRRLQLGSGRFGTVPVLEVERVDNVTFTTAPPEP